MTFIWSSTCGSGCTQIYQMNKDKEWAQGGYSSCSYSKSIENYPPAIWQSGMGFMYNNVSIYITRIIKYQFNENNISLVGRPPQSLDLTPIENAWSELKDRIYKLYPDIESFDGTKAQLKSSFIW